MQRSDLIELHYITPICNVPSILQHGILSHNRAKKLLHKSVAMREMQDKRAGKRVPGGLALHDYANLYVCARNPMLWKRLAQRQTLCVLSVAPDVLDIEGAVVSDSNAASDYVRFAAAPDGLGIVNKKLTFAEDWRDENTIEYWRKKAAKCAEVLVPDSVAPVLVLAAYVSCEAAKSTFDSAGTELRATVSRHLFFDV